MSSAPKKTKYQVVKFDAVIPVKESVNVKFRTKDGHFVTFEATKIVEKPTTVKFKSKK